MNQAPSAARTLFSNRTFGRLPYDSWHECILFAAMQSVGGPLPFLAVSSNWAESIIASPHLWNTILFDGGEDEEARIHTLSHLSQDLPLHLIYLDSGDGKTIERFINCHKLRIRSIENGGESRGGVGLSIILGTITKSLPSLRYLEGSWYRISKKFFSNCINLRVVRQPRLMIADEAYLGPHVESIGFSDVEPSEIVNLTHRTNIRELGLGLYRLWDQKSGEAFKAPMADLFTKIGHTLRNLTLESPFGSYSIFIPLISSTPGLHTLSLYLNVTRSLQKDMPQLATPQMRHSDVKNLRVLSIMLINTHESEYEDDEDWAGFDSGVADSVILSLTLGNTLKGLEDFTFSCDIPYHEDYVGPLLQSAISARVIRAFGLSEMIPTSLKMKRQLMPRLESLELPSLALYSCIDAPNLVKLVFDNDESVISVEINSTTDLQKLTLPGHFMDRIGISRQSSFNSKSIKFSFDICPRDVTPFTRLENVEFSNIVANKFLLKILEIPEAFPRLQTIAISGYPLWELLFEVLRKRNSSGLQRITRIRLPHLPVWQLLWRLGRLLGGETAAFTNRDVDEVIAKRIVCPQILCCETCIQAWYVSCIKRSQSLNYGGINSSDLQNLLDLDYPVDKESISASEMWSRWRNHQSPNWFSSRLGTKGMVLGCRASRLTPLMDITEHTLDGLSIPPWVSASGRWDTNKGLREDKY